MTQSKVFIHLDTTYEKKTEYYTYDKEDLLADVGGFLGMFLGWSFLTIILAALQYTRSGVLCLKRKVYHKI